MENKTVNKIIMLCFFLLMFIFYYFIYLNKDKVNGVSNEKSKEQIRLENKVLIYDSIVKTLSNKVDSLKKESNKLSNQSKIINKTYENKIEKIRIINNSDSICNEFKLIFTKNNIK